MGIIYVLGGNLYCKRTRETRLDNGLCATCGKQPHILEKKECESCREKRRLRQKCEYHGYNKTTISEKRRQFAVLGLCTRCGKNTPEEGKLTCELCLRKQHDLDQIRKDKVYEAYGGYQCACCGEEVRQFLTLDHINNDGASHRREVFGESRTSAGSHRSLYCWIIRNNFPSMFQVLCMNCNWGKRINGGVCPHKVITTKGAIQTG